MSKPIKLDGLSRSPIFHGDAPSYLSHLRLLPDFKYHAYYYDISRNRMPLKIGDQAIEAINKSCLRI